MKSLLFVLTLILCGCEGAYKKDENALERAYEKGFADGAMMVKRSIGLHVMDSINLNNYELATWKYDPKAPMKIVQSITFKYDSIMIINFDSSEVK